MKNLSSALIICIMFLLVNGCSSGGYLINSQDKLAAFPCSVSDSGVNVRIRNVGKLSFTQVDLLTDKKVSFAGLRKGEVSCYKNVPYLWTNNSLNVLFSKQEGYVKTLMALAIDHIGENRIQHGYVTIEIKVKKHHNELVEKMNLKIDSN